MTARRRYHVTYDLITPRSAIEGDTADNGFVTASEGRVSVAAIWGAEAGAVKETCALTLREAIQVFGWRYGLGALEGDYPSLYQPDGSTDHRTGEVERLAFHVDDKVTGASFERVRRMLEGATS